MFDIEICITEKRFFNGQKPLPQGSIFDLHTVKLGSVTRRSVAKRVNRYFIANVCNHANIKLIHNFTCNFIIYMFQLCKI